MNNDEVKAILDRYLRGEASDKERAFVEAWYNQTIDEQSSLPEEIDWLAIETKLSERFSTETSITFDGAVSSVPNRYRRLKRIAAVAAILLLTLGLALYVQWQQPQPIPRELVNTVIVPGGNKATLRLTDGTVISLNEEQSGIIVRGNSAYYVDGTAVLSGEALNKEPEVIRHLALSTPVGGQYQITLSDGTKVWLNASSTLTYPNTFSQSQERLVELSGEAYFEVVPDEKKPFKVKSKGQTVAVLGTEFNINAYDDEPAIKTTLLTGKVAITLPSGETRNLIPDQQSLVKIDDSQIYVRKVDGPDMIDWKNGDFVFNNESIEGIMRKISRWYDVDVEFRGKISAVNFGGVISRTKNITEVLQLLELTGTVHFKFEETKNIGKGRRIVVMP